MISQKLVEQIQHCADRITNDLVRALHSDPRCSSYRSIPVERLIDLKDDLHKNLGRWLSSRSKSAVESRYTKLGRERYLEGIPLHELIYAHTLTKSMLLAFIRKCVLGQAEDLPLEFELVLSVNEFFDAAICFAAQGYEDARHAGMTAPVADTASLPRVGPRVAEFTDASDVELHVSRAGEVGEASG